MAPRSWCLTFIFLSPILLSGLCGANRLTVNPVCEFDTDGDCDSLDIDNMHTAHNHTLVSGGTVIPGVNGQYDLIAVRTIDNLDLSGWLEQAYR